MVIAAVTSCENELPTYLKYSAYEFSGLDEDGGSWQPILFSSATDIPVAPPAAVNSSEYQAELAALKSATRNLNASQRKAVDYWTNNPLIRWNEIALELAAKYNLIPPPNPDGTYTLPSPANPQGPPPFPFAHPPYTSRMLADRKQEWTGKKVLVSGSGNVAIYAVQKLQQLGAKVIAMSDSNGYIVDEAGVDLELVRQIKEVERGRIKEYAQRRKGSQYVSGCNGIWTVPCDVALPCATQNEIDGESAQILVRNGCKFVAEGANMPSTPEAIEVFLDNNVYYGPAKAANAGGVATSALEMCQNSMRMDWSFSEVDAKLHRIMDAIYDQCVQAAEAYGAPGNLMVGANIAGFLKVARAMLAQGVV